MARNSSARAPEGTVSGNGRTPRRRGAPAGKEWVRPFKQTQRMLDNAASMLVQSVHTVADAGCCAHLPIRSTKKLIRALRQVNVATRQYAEAERFLVEATEAFAQAPPELLDGEAAELLEMATERCHTVGQYIHVAAQEVLLAHTEIFDGVASGELVPEEPSQELPEDRPRRRVIVITPRPLFVRAFLAARRQPRVGDRIAPLLRRRRRTLLPAEVRVPRRNLLGRAPPLSSTCAL
ncbi:MAG TPA: hypothetical protein VEO54_13815 [Thermoanaerobaculia bacterium]|nr:hypothetical protein [Thermoanaerobaculia bacterium]